jgi:hypothetical protein
LAAGSAAGSELSSGLERFLDAAGIMSGVVVGSRLASLSAGDGSCAGSAWDS